MEPIGRYLSLNNVTMKGSLEPSMNNDNDIEQVADMLVQKLRSPQSRPFYCLVAYKLPRGRIDYLLTTALEKGRNPGALFNHLARKEMT